MSYTIIENADHAAWLKSRTLGIGGSDAAAILGLNPYKSNVELFEEKTGKRMPEDISDKPLYHENRILRSVEHPFMQASLDGELTDQEGRKGILEIKTTNIMNSAQWGKWDGRIPDNYYIQVLHYLLVTGYQFAVLRAHIRSDWEGDRRTAVRHYFIERSDVEEDLAMLLQEEKKFWQQVTHNIRPGRILPEI